MAFLSQDTLAQAFKKFMIPPKCPNHATHNLLNFISLFFSSSTIAKMKASLAIFGAVTGIVAAHPTLQARANVCPGPRYSNPQCCTVDIFGDDEVHCQNRESVSEPCYTLL